MPVCGLPFTVETALAAVMGAESLSSWRVEGKDGNTVFTLVFNESDGSTQASALEGDQPEGGESEPALVAVHVQDEWEGAEEHSQRAKSECSLNMLLPASPQVNAEKSPENLKRSGGDGMLTDLHSSSVDPSSPEGISSDRQMALINDAMAFINDAGNEVGCTSHDNNNAAEIVHAEISHAEQPACSSPVNYMALSLETEEAIAERVQESVEKSLDRKLELVVQDLVERFGESHTRFPIARAAIEESETDIDSDESPKATETRQRRVRAAHRRLHRSHEARR